MNLLLALLFSFSLFAADQFKTEITVEPIPAKDAWKVTYQFSQPVTKIIFLRQVNRFRGSNWKPLEPNISIQNIDNEEVLISSVPVSTASFEFNSYYDRTPKDYEFFRLFSDKSVAMYTGHLDVCLPKDPCQAPAEFSFTPRKNESVLVAGEKSNKAIQWTDKKGRGTYVYFGKITPKMTKRLTLITDPKLPRWLSSKINRLLPQLFDYYTQQTGFALDFKPFIFINYSDGGNGNGRTGGTLPGLIAMTIMGNGWQKPDPGVLPELMHFLAHESAHLWNSQLFPHASREMWVHEGGADQFAYQALYDLGFADSQTSLGIWNTALNECLFALKNRPLKEVTEDPNFRPYYTCGSILHLQSFAKIKAKNPQATAFTFWREFFKRAKASGKPYDEVLYAQTLKALSADDQSPKILESFLAGKTSNSTSDYIREFQKLGIDINPDEQNLPRSLQLRLSKNLLREVMKIDCEGKHAVSQYVSGIELMTEFPCQTLKDYPLITHIEKFDVGTEALKAREAFERRCIKEKKVELRTIKNETLTLACSDVIPEREKYLSFKVLP